MAFGFRVEFGYSPTREQLDNIYNKVIKTPFK